MDMTAAKKLTYIANTVLFAFVVGMMVFFIRYHVNYLVYFSIPTVMVYIIGYFLIMTEHLDIYVWLIYFWIAIYMVFTTLCLGYSYGFQLYSMSLIPIIFISKYMGQRLETKDPHPVRISIILATSSLAVTAYTVVNGPIYVINKKIAAMFLASNSGAVFFFLILYSHLLIKMVMDSQEKLMRTAYEDRLTGLYNRHYMYEYLKSLNKESGTLGWLAMLDIDNFKKINDTYGHNCGDYVLQQLCKVMREVCQECVLSRWGGEEFLILPETHLIDSALAEEFRKKVAASEFIYEGQRIPVTITIGVSNYREEFSLDAWIRDADTKLYYGKNHGKNVVVENIPE